MRNWLYRGVLLVLVLGLLAVGVGPGSALAAKEDIKQADPAQAVGVEVMTISEQQRQSAERYWTPERLEQAKPLDLNVQTDGYDDEADKAHGPQPEAKVGSTTQQAPDPAAVRLAQQQYPDAWRGATTDVQAIESTPSTNYLAYTRYIMNQYSPLNYYPFSAMGRLFFTTASGSPASCSASVIANRGLITAAHCVYTKGSGWHRNFVFSPAHRGANSAVSPYGRFYGTQAVILSSRTSETTRYNDVAMITMADRNGYSIGQYLGTLGLKWNAGPAQNIWSFGYPSNIGSGQYLVACHGNSQQWETSGALWWKRTRSIKMGCDMTYGSSGGPWLVNYTPSFNASGNYVNSVVSGPATTAAVPEFQGPYFDDDNVKVLWNWIKNK